MVLYEDKIPDLSIAFKNLRKDLGLTMSVAADKLGVGIDAIKKWEKNGLPADKVLLVTKILAYNNHNWLNQVNHFYGVNLFYYDKGDSDEYEVNSVVFPELIIRDPYVPESYVLLVLQRAKEGFYTKKNEKREKYIKFFVDQGKLDPLFDRSILSKYSISEALVDTVNHQINMIFSERADYHALIKGYIDDIEDDEERALCVETVYSSLASNLLTPIEVVIEIAKTVADNIQEMLLAEERDHKVLAIYMQLHKKISYVIQNKINRSLKQQNLS